MTTMPPVRTHYLETYAPRTISTVLFRSLIESLDKFKPGLVTASRKIKSRAISYQKITDLEGPQSWHVVDSHSLAELEHLQTELLLVADGTASCELHIEFRGEHVLLSVSDIGTQWGKAVFEEARHSLTRLGITPASWKNTLAKAYGVLDILQNVLMTIAVALFAIWLQSLQEGHLYAAAGFFASGAVPTLKRLLHFYSPPKRMPIIQAAPVKRFSFPWSEMTAILTFLGAALALVKELTSIFA